MELVVKMFGSAWRKNNIKRKKKVARVKGKICFGTKDNAVGVLNEKANTIDTVVLGFGHSFNLTVLLSSGA